MGKDSSGEARIDGRTVYDGRILRLEVDRVRLTSGAEAVREVIRHNGAVVVLPVDHDGSVVLVRQHRYPTGELLLEAPAGKLDVSGESPAACAARELTEETGLRAGSLRWLGEFYTAPGFTDELLRCFLATDLEPVAGAVPDGDEIDEVVRLTPAELEDAIRANRIRDAKTLAIVLMARTQEE